MDLVTPDIGLIFWTTVSFAILYFILAKFAWKPILGAVNEREKSIKDALSAAEKAKEEMVNLKACLLYTSPSPRDGRISRMPSSA